VTNKNSCKKSDLYFRGSEADAFFYSSLISRAAGILLVCVLAPIARWKLLKRGAKAQHAFLFVDGSTRVWHRANSPAPPE